MSISYKDELNPAQLEAATHIDGPVLVIAGAGSGKTRTIVYRLAYLIEQGVQPWQVLLLTFTRKAAREMIVRAGELLNQPGLPVAGGTFHAYAFQRLLPHAHRLGYNTKISIADQSDAASLVKQARDELDIGRGDKSFPRKNTILELLSTCRNKERSLEQILDSQWHLQSYHDDLLRIFDRYRDLKKQYGLLDYDDLLFCLEELLREHPDVREETQNSISHIMVDEYQDTNPVQARIVRLLGDERNNVLVVGDDAQSIYGFRGAEIRNILSFPDQFARTKIIKLEQNYRSTQPILTLANNLLQQGDERFRKYLYSDIASDCLPRVFYPLSDKSQARLVIRTIQDLREQYPLQEIAVLFRAGFHSFALEVELEREKIPFRKFGGIKFSEAAHIRDVLAFLRVAGNTDDFPAWSRLLELVPQVGAKTARKIHQAIFENDEKQLTALTRRFPLLSEILVTVREVQTQTVPAEALRQVTLFYSPLMEKKFPDDFPRRQIGLEELEHIASGYDTLEAFLADLCLDPLEDEENQDQDSLVLSTIHSAKGLEWDAVLILDLVENRFPSRHAALDQTEMDEELRLMYVACTRARQYLGLFVPQTLYEKGSFSPERAIPSPFVSSLPADCCEKQREQIGGGFFMEEETAPVQQTMQPTPQAVSTSSQQLGYCTHKIFGRGKIIALAGNDKCRVNFPGFGIKLILRDYLTMEEK